LELQCLVVVLVGVWVDAVEVVGGAETTNAADAVDVIEDEWGTAWGCPCE